MLYGSDSDSGSEEDERATASKTQNRKTQAKKNKAQAQESTFIQEDEDEILDLLDDRMMSRISGAYPVSLIAMLMTVSITSKGGNAQAARVAL